MAQQIPFVVVSTSLAESPHGDFDGQVLSNGELTVNCIRAAIQRDNPTSEFLPTKVVDKDNNVIWQFEKGDGFQRAYLRELDEGTGIETCIVTVSVLKKLLSDVIPIIDLPRMARAVSNGRVVYTGGRSIKERLALKLVAGEDEYPVLGGKSSKLELELSQAEKILRDRMIAQVRAQREADRAAKQATEAAEKEEREKRAAERRREIMARKTVTVFTADGKPLHGTPVVGDVWECLPDNHPVIIFETFDADGGWGNPLTFFFVEKRNSRVGKRGLVESVTAHRPTRPGEKLVEIGEEMLFEIGEGDKADLVSAFGIASVEDMRTLRSSSKLNGGALVAVPSTSKPGYFDLYAFVGKEIKSKGCAKPLSA